MSMCAIDWLQQIRKLLIRPSQTRDVLGIGSRQATQRGALNTNGDGHRPLSSPRATNKFARRKPRLEKPGRANLLDWSYFPSLSSFAFI